MNDLSHRLVKVYPKGFALDASHHPHITMRRPSLSLAVALVALVGASLLDVQQRFNGA